MYTKYKMRERERGGVRGGVGGCGWVSACGNNKTLTKTKADALTMKIYYGRYYKNGKIVSFVYN